MDKLNCLAVADVFINRQMMQTAIDKYDDMIGESKILFFGENHRSEMRHTVKLIENGRLSECKFPEGYFEALAEAEILIVHLCPVTEEVIAHAPKLKYILCNRGGFENIDVDAASARKIKVLTNPAHNANAVAEFTIGVMFSEMRNISRAHHGIKEGSWREKFPNSGKIIELKDLTVGIVGFGNVGELVAEKLSGFGCNILVSNLFEPEKTNPRINWDKVKFCDLKHLLTNSDIVTLHARTPGNKPIFTSTEFEMMKKTAYFINTARPYMVDYKALYDALNQHEIQGAAIDVFEIEPCVGDDNPFIGLDNVTLTNHRGGDTVNSYADSPLMMFAALKDYLTERKPPKYWINRGAFAE